MFEAVISLVAIVVAGFITIAMLSVVAFMAGATVVLGFAWVAGTLVFWAPVYLFPFAGVHALCIGFKFPKWYLGVCDQAGSV